MTRRDMAHRGAPLAYTPDRPIYEDDDLLDLSWREAIEIAAAAAVLFASLVIVLLALSFNGPVQ